MGFLINGVSGKRLVLERGKSYTFDIRTDPKHDVYLSKKVIGWGSAPIAEGVTGAYTYKGKMIFSPGSSTPDNVYYSCRNHPHMGALIQIVNPGEKAKAIKQSTTPSPAAAAIQSLGSRGTGSKVTASKVKQKLMFAEMMSKSKGSKRVLASQNSEAKQLLNNAKSLISKGREKSQAGALPEALALADKSLKMMSEATRLVPGEEEMAQLADNYKSSLVGIRDYQKSHKANLARLEKLGTVSDDARYNEEEVAIKLSKAQVLADNKSYVRANVILSEVQKTITVALHRMLDSSTIVYDLNFATAADEYEYELKRFVGYEELIPVAIEAKKPAPGAIKLMNSFHEKARKRRDQAVARAAEGKHGDAIAMLQQATKTIRRALRMVGVMQ
jgi:tetratricopeptide (TPR) repeat protein